MTEYLLNFANVFGCDLLIFRQFPAGDRKIGNIRCFWTHQDSVSETCPIRCLRMIRLHPEKNWLRCHPIRGSQAASTAVESNQYQDWASAPSWPSCWHLHLLHQIAWGPGKIPSKTFRASAQFIARIVVPIDPYISYIWSNLLWHYTHFGGQKKLTQMKFTKFTKHWCSERPAGMRTRPYILTWKKHTKTPNG